MIRYALSIGAAAFLLFGLSLASCSDSETASRLSDEDVRLLDKQIAEAGSFKGGCEAIEALCSTRKSSCTASAVFCNVPTKEYVCQQLASSCTTHATACEVHDARCDDASSHRDAAIVNRDAGSVNRDAGSSIVDGEPSDHDGQVLLTDGAPPTKDTRVAKDTATSGDDSQVGPETLGCVGLMLCTENCSDERCTDKCVIRAKSPATVTLFDAALQCIDGASNGTCLSNCTVEGSSVCVTCIENACKSQMQACEQDPNA